ncbi:MAG: AsmA family protein [Alphaproteobacteria bacterium]|nr:AsmA family protein [Alphaproteobacteria bacterium]
MKALKWIVIGLVGLIVLAVGGVAVFLSTLDVNKYKPQIVEAAKNATGRELKLTGDIKLGLGFNPSFSVADVSFANASWGSRPEMVKVGRFEVQVALIPLLSQQVDVKKLVLLDADLLIETDRQGRGNWEFAPAQPAAAQGQQRQTQQQQAPAAQTSGGAMPLPVVREVEIRNLRFTYKDGKTNETNAANLEKVLLNADSVSSPLKLDIAGGATAPVVGDVKFALAGTVGSIERMLANSGPAWPVDLTAKLADVVTATVKGGIVAPTQGKGLDIVLGVDVPDLAKLGALVKQDIPAIGPVKAELQLTDAAPQGRPSIPRLAVTAGAVETILATITGAVTDPTNATTRGIKLDIKAESRDLAGLFKALKQDAPVTGPLSLQAAISEPAANRIDVTGLNLKVGNDNAVDLAGTINATLPTGNAKPSVTANLQSQQVDLTKLFPATSGSSSSSTPASAPAASGGAAKPAGDGRVIPNEKLPYEALNAANANITYRAGQIVTEPATLRALNLQVALANGNLTVRPLTFEIEGGRVSVESALNGAQKSLTQKVEVRNLDVGKVLESRKLSDWFKGGVTAFDLNLQGRGETPRAVAASLQGDVFLNMGEGELGQAAVRFVGQWLNSVAPGLAQVNIGTSVKCGIHKIDFRDGIGTYKAGLIETGIISARTQGTVNLATEQLALGQTAGPIALRIGGTFANPSYAPDAAAMAQGLAAGVLGTAAGIATGGASSLITGLVANSAASRVSGDPCANALAAATGRAAPPQQTAPANQQRPAQQQAPAQQQQQQQQQPGGVGGAIRGLFGR